MARFSAAGIGDGKAFCRWDRPWDDRQRPLWRVLTERLNPIPIDPDGDCRVKIPKLQGNSISCSLTIKSIEINQRLMRVLRLEGGANGKGSFACRGSYLALF